MAKKEILTSVLAAIILYAVAIVYQGYQYGAGDQSQILPCLRAQDHPGAYANDHYVQHYLASGVNERTIFHFLLRRMGYDQPWMVFFWQMLSAIALIWAWISIASLFIKTSGWQWLCIGLILTLGVHTATGSNEIYYHFFVPSLPAKALASWGIYYWMKGKYFRWSLLLILAGYLQPLVGLQLFLLTSLAMIIEKWKIGKFNSIPWKYIFFYVVTTLPWVYLLAINNGGHTDPKGFVNIIQFRLSHHFFASSFGWVNLFFGFIFAIIAISFFKEKVKWLLLSIVAGCIFYEIGLELLRMPVVLYTQWWKTTIWMESFAFITCFALIEKIKFFDRLVAKLHLLAPLCLLALVCFYRLSGFFGEKPNYMLPWIQTKTEDVDISEMAQKLTSENALFILPPDLTAFRWYSRRDTYVDYKAMIHTETFLKDWYNRIDQIYGYNIEQKKSGISFSQKANDVLRAPSTETLEKWKTLGVTHLISATSGIHNLQLIGNNKKFSIYKIP